MQVSWRLTNSLENATVEQKARLLETRVVENVDTIEHLRQERAILVNEHKGLQRRFKDATDVCRLCYLPHEDFWPLFQVANDLRTKCTSLSTAHDNRRNELDMHRLEIEELRKALEDRASDLQRMEREKEKASSEKDNVARTVAGLEADLQRVKRDAEAFGKDLQALRAEKENLEARSKEEIVKAERTKKQAQAQIRLLTEQLNAEKDRASKAIGQMESRVPVVWGISKSLAMIADCWYLDFPETKISYRNWKSNTTRNARAWLSKSIILRLNLSENLSFVRIWRIRSVTC